MRQKLDCYLNNHCLEDQPSPNPAPLTPEERRVLYATWQSHATPVARRAQFSPASVTQVTALQFSTL